MIRTLLVASLVALAAGCSSSYEPRMGTSADELKQNIAAAKAESDARIAKAKAEADAAAAASQAKLDAYLKGEGASRPAAVQSALKEGRVEIGMTQAEVSMIASAVKTKSVSTQKGEVVVTWEGVACKGGPAMKATKSKGHAAPLTVTFVNGSVTKVSSSES